MRHACRLFDRQDACHVTFQSLPWAGRRRACRRRSYRGCPGLAGFSHDDTGFVDGSIPAVTQDQKSKITLNGRELVKLGYTQLTGDQANLLLEDMYQTLETLVGMRIAGTMTDAQLDEFERFYDAGDNAAALDWLQRNFPEYPAIAREEYAIMLEGLRSIVEPAATSNPRMEVT